MINMFEAGRCLCFLTVISELIGCFVVLGFNQAIFMWLKDFPKFDLVVYVLLIVMYEGIGSSANPDDNFLIIPC